MICIKIQCIFICKTGVNIKQIHAILLLMIHKPCPSLYLGVQIRGKVFMWIVMCTDYSFSFGG